jgi:hypothetical protein
MNFPAFLLYCIKEKCFKMIYELLFFHKTYFFGLKKEKELFWSLSNNCEGKIADKKELFKKRFYYLKVYSAQAYPTKVYCENVTQTNAYPKMVYIGSFFLSFFL